MWRASAHRTGGTPRRARLVSAEENPVAARLLPVSRFLIIVLLALLPLQFSWAAVAPYCGHETQAGLEHFGHHEHQHQHHADASDGAGLDAALMATSDANSDAGDGKAPGVMDLDCGHCHGTCSMMFNLPSALPGALSTAPPSATLDESGGAHAPTRPERSQWLPLA